MISTFAEMDLRPELAETLSKWGFTTPTEVQAQTFPLVSSGVDIMVQSRTGTGKTLAFVLPVLQRMEADNMGEKENKRVKILAIAPTRELAVQVGLVFAKAGRLQGIHVATLTGGAAYGDQLRALRLGAQVVVGTPGRLVDHIDRGTLDLSNCTTVVLDEADEILDMGFQEDLEKILGKLPAEKQSLLFSATLPDGIETIARRYMRKPYRLNLSAGMEASTSLSHAFYEIHKDSKIEALVNLLHLEQPELAILFCHTKAETEEIARRMTAEGFQAAYLNGDLPQVTRTKTLDAFRKRQISLLVATDVAARGIDVLGITHIVNFGIPRGVETYIHRSGRAGRMGRPGKVINLVTPLDRVKMRTIIRDAKLTAEIKPVPQGEEVRKKMRERFFEELVSRADANNFGDLADFAGELANNIDPAAVIAALLQDLQATTGKLAVGYDVLVPSNKREPRDTATRSKLRERPERGAKPLREEGMTRLRLNLGRNSQIQPGYLVRMICEKAGLTSAAIGAISLFSAHSLVDIKSDSAEQVITAMNATPDDRGRRWNVTRF
ncbi:MAG TPA: RNA helicase [Cyanobacteria bacterium UBA8530]|nr:RNA helicase [Cyanobacteria bacterium UBA8530]